MQNGQALGLVGQADVNQHVKAPRSQQRRVHHVGPIRGSQHQYTFEFFDAVEFGQELADHALAHTRVGRATAAPRCQCIDLVKEHQTGCGLLGFLKNLAHGALRFTNVFGHQRRSLDRNEVDLGRAGCCLRQQRLAAAGRTRQQNALERLDTSGFEQIAVLQRPLQQFAQQLLRAFQAADIVPTGGRHFDKDFAQGRGFDLAQCRQKIVLAQL